MRVEQHVRRGDVKIEGLVRVPRLTNYKGSIWASWDDDAHVFLGTSSNGIPAWIKREVAEADVRIGLGTVIPHMDAGFSGGAKIILPGVCNSLTVDAFHDKCIIFE